MGMLVNGEWTTKWYEPDKEGHFVRNDTRFRDRVTADGSSGFPAAAGRYHLYVSLACPWAHRTLIMRARKGLEKAISLSIVDPFMGDDGWSFSEFPGSISDSVNDARFLREIYQKADPEYTGRVTVPVLWDRETETIVNNESREILRMLDVAFDAFAEHPEVHDVWPEMEAEIDATITALYKPINNGVYRAGFAVSQRAYDEAAGELFRALDGWDAVLGRQRYLTGNRISEADWCFFTTLLRFDAVYYVHFKCNWKRIADYPNLSNYLRDLYQQPGVAGTVNLEHIKQHYYRSHPMINPHRIVPLGPQLDFAAPHDRDRFGS